MSKNYDFGRNNYDFFLIILTFVVITKAQEKAQAKAKEKAQAQAQAQAQ